MFSSRLPHDTPYRYNTQLETECVCPLRYATAPPHFGGLIVFSFIIYPTSQVIDHSLICIPFQGTLSFLHLCTRLHTLPCQLDISIQQQR